MRAPLVQLFDDEIIVDSFAGGGGASVGIQRALGRSPDIAINHDREAIEMHRVNHPDTKHYIENVWKVDPRKVTAGKRVGLMWLSPDCKHFSKAKGGKPKEKNIRALAWIAVHWAKALKTRKPRVIILENVQEFADWGPLLENGQPCPLRKGKTFRKFVKQLQNLGYDVDWQMLKACDYGSPTSRERLFLVARCDGQPIVWPAATHGPGRIPYRTAAECIQWERPCPSIFERVKPLAENTERRIVRGIFKYVVNAAAPFIVPVAHAGDSRVHSVDEPMRTITGAHRGEHALIRPFIAGIDNKSSGAGAAWSASDPLKTVTLENRFALVAPFVSAYYGDKGASSDRCREVVRPLPTQTGDPRFALVAPTLVQTGYGERKGQAPRCLDLHTPLGTCVDGQKHGLVSAFLAKHYGDTGQRPGIPMTEPVATITACDHHALVASSIVKLRGTSRHGQAIDKPLGTVSAQGNHFAEVRAFLMKYHRDGGQLAALGVPMPTVVANDSFALVQVNGVPHAIVDIGMRMLQPRELFRAHGFEDSYEIEKGADGKPLTKGAQVRMCGNSVPPDLAAAVVYEQFAPAQVARAA
jgi:DNA (cytosine-5)-methyltransferase 1